MPFQNSRLKAAFAVEPDELILVGESDRVSGFRVYRYCLTSQRLLRSIGFSDRASNYYVTGKGEFLWAIGGLLRFLCLDLRNFKTVLRFNAVDFSSTLGRPLYLGDYFTIDHSARNGDARRFHSPELEQKYLAIQEHVQINPGGRFIAEGDGEKVFTVVKRSPFVWRGASVPEQVFYEPFGDRSDIYEVDYRSPEIRRFGIVEQLYGKPYTHRVVHISGKTRTAVSQLTSFIPYASGDAGAQSPVYGCQLPEVTDHRDIAMDGKKRIGIGVCHWKLDRPDPTPKVHVIFMMTVEELAESRRPKHLTPDQYKDILLFETAVSHNRQDTGLLARAPTREDGNGNKVPNRDHALSKFGLLQLFSVYADASDDHYWVRLPVNCLRRVSIGGSVGPLIKLEVLDPILSFDFHCDDGGNIEITIVGTGVFKFHQDSFDREPSVVTLAPTERRSDKLHAWTKPFRKFVNGRTVVEISVADLTAPACAQALRKQAGMVREGFDDLITGDRLRFSYKSGRKRNSEEEFFEHIVAGKFDVSRELEDLLDAYLDQLARDDARRQPWYSESEPALAFALRAYVLLDPNPLQTFRRFLAARDGEHEFYCGDVLLPKFAEAVGWRGEEGIKFGIYALINLSWGLGNPPAQNYGIFGAAREQLQPTQLARIIIEEAEAFDLTPQWNHQNPNWYILAVIVSVDTKEPYSTEMLRELSVMRPAIASEIHQKLEPEAQSTEALKVSRISHLMQKLFGREK